MIFNNYHNFLSKYNDFHHNFYIVKNKNLKKNNLNTFQYLICIIRNIIPLNIRNYICYHFCKNEKYDSIVLFEKVSIKK